MSNDDVSNLKLRDSTIVPCTFCGGEINLAYIDEGEEKDLPVCLHTMPPCQTFIDLGMLEFVSSNRRRLGISDSDLEGMDN